MIVRRIAVGTVLAALGCTAALLDTSARADPTPRFTLPEQTVTQVRTVQARDHGHSAAYWHLRNQQARRELKLGVLRQHRLAHTLARETRASRRRYSRDVTYAIHLASAVYGVPEAKMRAVAYCESTLSPYAVNGRYRGLFQLGWAPFGLDPFDPVANALSAAQTVVRDGSWREWSCGGA